MSELTVGVSAGTATVMGLQRAPLLVAPTTAYLMVGGRCTRDCSFCAQASSSVADQSLLSRVTWPPFDAAAVLDAIGTHPGAFQRVCVQTTSTPHSFEQALSLVRRLRQCTTVPVDVSVLPPNATALDEVFAAGADHVGFGIDAATPQVFARAKGPGWEHYTRLIARATERYPGRAAVHLIAGLGESERDLSLAIQEYRDAGVVVGLFAFCPVAGTRMAEAPRPSLASYRRLQVARALVAAGLGRAESFAFDDDGALVGYGNADLTCLSDGHAFLTSGCPGCNRPFYNERPSGPMYNYPRPLTSAESAIALAESGVSELTGLARAHA